MDRLAVASSFGERYDHGWWLKETILRSTRAHLRALSSTAPENAEAMKAIERDLICAIYLGDFAGAVAIIERLPSK